MGMNLENNIQVTERELSSRPSEPNRAGLDLRVIKKTFWKILL